MPLVPRTWPTLSIGTILNFLNINCKSIVRANHFLQWGIIKIKLRNQVGLMCSTMHTQYEGHMFSFSCIVTPIFEPWKIITLFNSIQTNSKLIQKSNKIITIHTYTMNQWLPFFNCEHCNLQQLLIMSKESRFISSFPWYTHG
jgi:hypothetical protein